MKRTESIFPLLFPVIISTIFFITFFRANRRKEQVLKKLSACLNGSLAKFSFMPSFKGEYQGLRFSISILAGNKSSPDYLEVSFAKNSSFSLSIYKESVLSEFGEKLGVIRKLKVNDPVFDKDFLIFSKTPEKAAVYFGNIAIKTAIRELFNSGFNSFSIDGKKVVIRKPKCDLASDFQTQKIMAVLGKLSLAAHALI